MNTNLPDKFPPQNEKDLFDILQFVKKSPFAKDYWNVLKSLYKQSEQAIIHQTYPTHKEAVLNIVTQLIIRIDQENIATLSSPYPTRATLRYMKRRARRFLRELAQTSPVEYFNIASKILLANEGKTSLDFDNQWITVDIILGKSKRCIQKGHGQGKYVFENQKYNLHHREERNPKIWDEQNNFVQSLLGKDIAWEILEFSVKTLHHNQIKVQDLLPETLERFFASSSNWLKRVATEEAYKVYTFQGIKENVYAGMWLYSNASMRRRIQDIDANRSKKDSTWYDNFSKSLSKYTLNELLLGNNSRRIIHSIEFLQKQFSTSIPKDKLLAIAPALFHSHSKTLQELAFLGAKSSTQEDALEWILALDNGQQKLSIPVYDRLAVILLEKFKKKNLYYRDLEKYIYNTSFAACDFGWRLSKNVRYEYQLYNLWNSLSEYNRRRRIKEIYFHNTITSMAGADAFLRYYGKNSYSLNHYPDQALVYIFKHGLDRIKNLIVKKITQNFVSSPIDYIYKVSLFPEDLRDKVLSDTLKKIANKNIFRYSWRINHLFVQAKDNEWIFQALLRLIGGSHIDHNAASNILSACFDNQVQVEEILQFINTLKDSKRKLFLTILGENHQYIIDYGAKIPVNMLEETIRSTNLDTLLNVTSTANEENWKVLQQAIYTQLSHKERQTGFWKEILERLIHANSTILNKRLLENETFFELFKKQKDTSILDITDPEFETVLFQWVEENAALFIMGSPELFKLCLHKIPKLRHWGLTHARNAGISLIFGLQLFESDLPDAVQEAKNYFQKLPVKSSEELDAVLAICDSPNRQVRSFGMEYLTERKENFSENSKVLEFLSEHADTSIQDFVAKELQVQNIVKPFVKRFDKEILRTKNKARKAKEKVKARIEQNLEIDVATLFEIAGSKTKGDAEWAIEQLTKKALAGEEIEGFTVE